VFEHTCHWGTIKSRLVGSVRGTKTYRKVKGNLLVNFLRDAVEASLFMGSHRVCKGGCRGDLCCDDSNSSDSSKHTLHHPHHFGNLLKHVFGELKAARQARPATTSSVDSSTSVCREERIRGIGRCSPRVIIVHHSKAEGWM
jgi:hypothetical protein